MKEERALKKQETMKLENYDVMKDKEGQVEKEEKKRDVFSDDFMDGLKVIDVPDSDDEAYF